MQTPVLDSLELKDKVTENYLELYRLYSKTNKLPILQQAEAKLLAKDYDGAAEILNQLPDREQLLLNLMERLKHKSVGSTLRKIRNGRTENIYQSMKGLFSLGTHICIMLEKGETEYRAILDEVLESIQRHLNASRQ